MFILAKQFKCMYIKHGAVYVVQCVLPTDFSGLFFGHFEKNSTHSSYPTPNKPLNSKTKKTQEICTKKLKIRQLHLSWNGGKMLWKWYGNSFHIYLILKYWKNRITSIVPVNWNACKSLSESSIHDFRIYVRNLEKSFKWFGWTGHGRLEIN